MGALGTVFALVLVLAGLFAPVASAPTKDGAMDAEMLTREGVKSVEKLLWAAYDGFRVGKDKSYDYPTSYQDENGNDRPKPNDDYFMHSGETSVGALVALLTVAAQKGLLSESFRFFDLGCSRGHTCLVVLLVCLRCIFSSGIELAKKRIKQGNKAIRAIRDHFPTSFKLLQDKVKLETGNIFYMMRSRMAELSAMNVVLWADLVFNESRGPIWENLIVNMEGLRVLIVNQPWPGLSERFVIIHRGHYNVSYCSKPREFLMYKVQPPSVERFMINSSPRASGRNISKQPIASDRTAPVPTAPTAGAGARNAQLRIPAEPTARPPPVESVEIAVSSVLSGNGLKVRRYCFRGEDACDKNTCDHPVETVLLDTVGIALLFNALFHAGMCGACGITFQLFGCWNEPQARVNRWRAIQRVQQVLKVELDQKILLALGADAVRNWDDPNRYGKRRASYDEFEGEKLIPNSLVEFIQPGNRSDTQDLDIAALDEKFPLLADFLRHVTAKTSAFGGRLRIHKVLLMIKDAGSGLLGFSKRFHIDEPHGLFTTSFVGPLAGFDSALMPVSVGKPNLKRGLGHAAAGRASKQPRLPSHVPPRCSKRGRSAEKVPPPPSPRPPPPPPPLRIPHRAD